MCPASFFTGLFFALPLLNGESVVVPTTNLESAGYLAITREAQDRFGVTIRRERGLVHRVPGPQRYQPCGCRVEADWSQAAFWYAARHLGSAVTVAGMDPASPQGDRVIVDMLDFFRDERAHRSLDVCHIPDLVPPLVQNHLLHSATDVVHGPHPRHLILTLNCSVMPCLATI